MATKTEQVPPAASKQGQTGYKQQGSHRRAHEKGPSTPSRNHEDSPRKKLATVQFSPRNHGKGDGRSKGAAGGRDSLQQSSRHENKHGSRARDTEQHSNSRHGRPVHVLTEKPHSRRSHHHKHPGEGKGDLQTRRGGGGGHRSHHGIRKPAAREEEVEGDVNPDSGISIEETSSPEVAPQLEGDTGCEEGLVETEEPLEGREEEVKGANEEEEEPVLVAEEEVCTGEDTVRRITYTREELLGLKDHCLSHVRPKSLPYDIQSAVTRPPPAEMGWVAQDQDPEPVEDSHVRHPTTLSLLREHDSRFLPKVSLSPQRRSFGSGCSWRDAAASASAEKPSGSGSSTTPGGGGGGGGGSSDPLEEQEEKQYYEYNGRGRPPPGYPPPLSTSQHGPQTPHTPRIINHVPYLSRQQWGPDEQGQPRSSWRDRASAGGMEDEPEWMAFGPSDRSEVIELCGLEEHEARKEAAKNAQGGKELKKVEEDGEEEKEEECSPPSPHSPQDGGKERDAFSSLRDALMPSSSSPNDDFIVDGFDFSTGVSICHELASDSGDEDESMIAPVKGPLQLGTALMKVLGVSKPQQQPADMLPGGRASNPVRAVTLEEIEEHASLQSASRNSPKQQSAFDKFLAALQSSSQEERRPQEVIQHGGSEVTLQSHSMRLPHPPPHPSAAAGPPVRASPAVMAGILEDHSARVAALNTPFQESPLPHSKLLMRPSFDRLHMGGDHTGMLSVQQQWPPNTSPWPPSSSASYGMPVGLTQPHPPPPPPPTMVMPSGLHSRGCAGQQQRQNTNWVAEMERQRMVELHQMQLRERMMQQQQQQQQKMSSSPAISLLPTAVIRQMHNSKPKQLITEYTKSPPVASRLEQELSNRASQMAYNSILPHPDSSHGVQAPRSAHTSAQLPYTMRADPLMGLQQSAYTNTQAQLPPPQYRMGVSTMKPAGASY